MLPIVDKPAIQYVVEEAVASGIEDILIVTSHSKRSIEDHFDRSGDLEGLLEASGKHDLLAQIRDVSELADIHYIRQKAPRGLGQAIMVASKHVGREPFVVLLGDDVIDGAAGASPPLLDKMLDVFEEYGRSVVAVLEVPESEISQYGCVRTENPEASLSRIINIVEKPVRSDAPTPRAVIGRYIFTPEIFDALDGTSADAENEIQLTDAIARLAGFQTVYAYLHEGTHYPIGDKLAYLRATVALAASRPDLGEEFRGFLRDFVDQIGAT